MTDTSEFVDTVTSVESFDAVMEDLLLAALVNDVDPRGSWVYRNGESAPDLEVLVTELRNQSEG